MCGPGFVFVCAGTGGIYMCMRNFVLLFYVCMCGEIGPTFLCVGTREIYMCMGKFKYSNPIPEILPTGEM